LGPSLYGLYGRTAGAQPRNSLLPSSPTMKESGVVWTDITLMRYLKNPRAFAEHAISMNFRGLSEWQVSCLFMHSSFHVSLSLSFHLELSFRFLEFSIHLSFLLATSLPSFLAFRSSLSFFSSIPLLPSSSMHTRHSHTVRFSVHLSSKAHK
ncbi:putative cytochrome C family protein, partial [Toxoplasma gondii FOU]